MAATDELSLLERVFLRVGSAETDDQLQNAVAKFLLPVLLKLSSQQEGVRKKVMELLVHINKRIKCRPKIQLPVEALLLQYQDPAATSFVTNFTIIYIKMGFPRLDIDKQSELLSTILSSIDGKPQSHQDSLLLMIMPVFGHVKIPTDAQKRKSMFGLHEKPKVAQLLLEFMLDVLLLPYGPPPVAAAAAPDVAAAGTPAGAPASAAAPATLALPGLSENAYKRVTSEFPLIPEELEKAKMGIVKFLGGGFLSDEDVIVHLIVASSDTRHSVVNAAELELRRSIGSSEYSTAVINKLYALFLGTITVKDQKPAIKPENKRAAANPRIRMKILPHLLKSREAATCFPACIQMVFDCLYGNNTNAKLKLMAVQFVHHICLHCSDARLSPIGPILMSGMLKLINSATEEPKLRSIAYVAIGKLGCKLPQLVTKDLVLIQKFFDSMSVENQDTKLAIQEALSIMRHAFKKLDPANLKMMHALLAANMEKSEPQVRLIAVQYVSSVFPSSDIPSRYLLLLAAGDSKEEVYAEAAKALQTVPSKTIQGSNNNNTETVSFPPFTEIVCFISEKAESRMKSKQYFTVGTHKLPFSPATCTETMTYMRLCLVHSAGLEPSIEQEMREQAPVLSKYVGQLLKEQPREKGAIQLYIDFIRQFLSVINGTASMYYLLEIVAVAPKILAPHVVPQLEWIKGFVFSTKEDMRYNASQLYAIVVAHGLDADGRVTSTRELTKGLQDKVLEKQHGSALALGFLLGRLAFLNGKKTGENVLEKIANGVEAVKALAGLLTSTQTSLVSAACTALGEIGRNGVLPLPDEGKDDEVSKLSIVKALKDIVKSNKHTAKHQEKAALAASYLCVGDSKFPHARVVMEGFLESGRERSNVDLAFTVGEALAWCALGPMSPVARDFWSTSEDDFIALKKKKGSGSQEHLPWLLLEIITKYANSQNPNVRQASCVWLLCLLKNCKDYPEVKDKLDELQSVFINLLSETNDITQDSASKGLGLIYEYCEEQQRSKLVAVLVDTLMSGRRRAQQVTDDTKIFEEGTMESNPQGAGLSTYKELCSLASDLSQPDLVYKFMNLSNHNAIWNSKKGAAFGFGTIAAKAGEQLQVHLPVIIPKLFRYQFDPNIKIQQSMSSIWNSIVTDSQKTVDLNVKEILADLKINLTSNLWRNRESSCSALADLLRGRQLDLFVDDLPELWEICFRVRDDIKESVRVAAESALKSLSKVLIKVCDSNVDPVGHKAIATVLPVLLKSGLMSPVLEVRTISLATLTKIGKTAGALLTPHIPLLAVSLLESLSALEQQEFNYLSVRLGNQQNTQEKWDNARISASRSSPMMDTINQCLPFVNETVLEELIPRLIDLIKSSVGLSTKAGCAHLVTMLTHHCLTLLQPHAGRLLAALLFGLNDRSLAIRKCYSNAIGNLVKAAKDSSVEKLIERLKTSYLEKDEAAARYICAHVLHSIARQSPDVLKLHSAKVLSLAFLAMHSPKQTHAESQAEDRNDNEIWEEIWGDMTAGMENGIRLYLVEIVEILQLAIQSQDWNMRVRVALSVSTVATKLKSSLSSPYLETLIQIVVAGMSGRTWDGKEHMLKAVSVICVECKDSIQDSAENSSVIVDVNEIVNSLLKECNKENIKYQKDAIRCTVDVLYAYKIDKFKEIFALAQAIVKKSKRQDDDDDDDAKARKSPEIMELQEVAFMSLGRAWPHDDVTQEMFRLELCEFLCSTLSQYPQKVQISVLKAMNHFVERLHALNLPSPDVDGQLSAILTSLIPQVCSCAEGTKASSIRKEVIDIFECVLSKLKANDKLHLVADQQERIKTCVTQIVAESQTEIREKGNQVIKVL